MGDYFLAGLSLAGNRQVEFALRTISNDLSDNFVKSVNLVELAAELLVREYKSVEGDLNYWRGIAQSSTLNRRITDLHTWIFYKLEELVWWSARLGAPEKVCIEDGERKILLRNDARSYALFTVDEVAIPTTPTTSTTTTADAAGGDVATAALATPAVTTTATTPASIDQVESKISVLRSFQNRLARSLAQVKEAAEHLKQIYAKVNHSHTSAKEFDALSRSKLTACLEGLANAMREYESKRPVQHAASIGAASAGEARAEVTFAVEVPTKENVGEALVEANKILHSFDVKSWTRFFGYAAKPAKDYPLNLAVKQFRKPSSLALNWPYYVTFSLGAGVAARELWRAHQSGWLETTIKALWKSCERNFKEVIIEPTFKLVDQLLAVVNPPAPGSVSLEDFDAAQKDLETRLRVFYHTQRGRSLLDRFYEATSHLLATKAPPASTRPEPTIEEMMRVLTESLKIEKSPLVDLVTGDLLTVMLAQASQMRVFMMSAMIRMEQILAANQLIMKLVPAVPGFGIIFYTIYNSRYIFWPSPPKPGNATLKVRLALSDVERSLQEVHSLRESEKEHRTLLHSPSRPGTSFTSFPSSPAASYVGLSLKTRSNEDLVPNNETRIRVAKGKLCYYLLRLRRRLARAFKSHSFVSSWWEWIFGKPESDYSPSSNNSQYSFASLVSGSNNDEYSSILRDLHRLESPDDEVSGRLKIATADRMRTSYSVFLPSV